MDRDIVGGRIVQDDKPRQVEAIELSERHERICPDRPSPAPVEASEQASQLVFSRRSAIGAMTRIGRLRQHRATAFSGIRAGRACRRRRGRCRIHALHCRCRAASCRTESLGGGSGPVETKPTFSEIDHVVAAIKDAGPLLRRRQQVPQRRHRTVVQIRAEQPDPDQRPGDIAVLRALDFGVGRRRAARTTTFMRSALRCRHASTCSGSVPISANGIAVPVRAPLSA